MGKGCEYENTGQMNGDFRRIHRGTWTSVIDNNSEEATQKCMRSLFFEFYVVYISSPFTFWSVNLSLCQITMLYYHKQSKIIPFSANIILLYLLAYFV